LLEELRDSSDSVEEFLKTVAEFGEVDDLPEYLGVAAP
jgi:hypothetical protein